MYLCYSLKLKLKQRNLMLKEHEFKIKVVSCHNRQRTYEKILITLCNRKPDGMRINLIKNKTKEYNK